MIFDYVQQYQNASWSFVKLENFVTWEVVENWEIFEKWEIFYNLENLTLTYESQNNVTDDLHAKFNSQMVAVFKKCVVWEPCIVMPLLLLNLTKFYK